MDDLFFISSRVAINDPVKWFQPKHSMANRLINLMERSIPDGFIRPGDIVAVKTHFGETGASKMIRSLFIKKIVEYVKKKGGKPFVTETCGLGLVKDRSTAYGRIQTALENGYTTETVGAPIIIADGLKGMDFVEERVGGKYIKNVKVAKALAEADKMIVVSRVKGHIRGGFGAAIKNLGLGCVAKPSKYNVHITDFPKINQEKCTRCNKCVEVCPPGAISLPDIDSHKCVKCSGCFEVCPDHAVEMNWLLGVELTHRTVDNAVGVVNRLGNDNIFYLNFITDVTPHCDCQPYVDNPIVSDIGILAGANPVSMDRASMDMINKAAGLANSLAESSGGMKPGADKLKLIYDWTDPYLIFEYAQKFGLGEIEYNIRDITPDI